MLLSEIFVELKYNVFYIVNIEFKITNIFKTSLIQIPQNLEKPKEPI